MPKQPIDDSGVILAVLKITHGTSQNVNGTNASAQSTVLHASKKNGVARIAALSNLYYAVGANPTATVGHVLLPAGQVEYIWIDPGMKIAVIGGIANITAV